MVEILRARGIASEHIRVIQNWFDDEEGYWAFVVLAFPEHFTASMLQNADEMVDFLEREYRKEERLPADEFPGDLKTGTLP